MESVLPDADWDEYSRPHHDAVPLRETRDTHKKVSGDLMSQLRLSVVVGCFKQSRELDLSLRSFLRQTLSKSLYEIIVVDDSSPDYTARQVVARLRGEYVQAQLSYVRHHRSDAGIYGSSAQAKNIGLRLARGAVVLFNNAEIVQAGDSMSHILRRMEETDVPLCLRGRVLDLSFEELEGLGQRELGDLHDRTPRSRERVASADHAGLAAVERRLLLAVGGNDERFDYWGKEDLDLAARLKRAGCRYVYDDGLRSFHISHSPNHVKAGDYRRMVALLEANERDQLVEANRGQIWGTLTPAPIQELDGTVIVEADADGVDLARRLTGVVYGAGAERHEVIVVCSDVHRAAAEKIAADFNRLPVVSLAPDEGAGHVLRVSRHIRTRRAAFLPTGCPYAEPPWKNVQADAPFVMPWVPRLSAPTETARSEGVAAGAWLASSELLGRIAEGPGLSEWTAVNMERSARRGGTLVRWGSARLTDWFSVPSNASDAATSKLGPHSRVAALIPHFECHEWLGECLETLTMQSHAPDAIIVIDDHSRESPIDIVRAFPQVTLLASKINVGPYRLVQQVIGETDYDGYLFQDADDWSSVDRLELLLHEAQRTGASMVGSQHMRFGTNGELAAVCYPLDVTRALQAREAHPVAHATSLISRDLFVRAGGLSSALRFGADTEFLLRVGHATLIANVPEFCYFQRERPNSLTTSRFTGFQSAPRQKLTTELKAWAAKTRQRRAEQHAPILPPLASAGPIDLLHLAGPPIASSGK